MLTERRIRKRAGVSAAAEYEKLTREWRRRNRRLFRTLTGVCALVAVVALLAGLGEVRGWLCGLIAGIAICFLILARESPPPWIGNYLVGAAGEERTAKALEPLLREGWFMAHDLDRGKFNIDHVIVGPGGVFALETKNLYGTVTVSGDKASLVRPGRDRPDYSGTWWAREVRSHAFDANQLFRHRATMRPWVTAVVVLWADFPAGVVDGDRVTFIAGDRLASWLSDEPVRLSAQQIARLRSALEPQHRRSGAVAGTLA